MLGDFTDPLHPRPETLNPESQKKLDFIKNTVFKIIEAWGQGNSVLAVSRNDLQDIPLQGNYYITFLVYGLVAIVESGAETKDLKIFGKPVSELLEKLRVSSFRSTLPVALAGVINNELEPNQNFGILGPSIVATILTVVWDQYYSKDETRNIRGNFKLDKNVWEHILKPAFAFFRGYLYEPAIKASMGGLLKDFIEQYVVQGDMPGLLPLYAVPAVGEIIIEALESSYGTRMESDTARQVVRSISNGWQILLKMIESFSVTSFIGAQLAATATPLLAAMTLPQFIPVIAVSTIVSLWAGTRSFEEARERFREEFHRDCLPTIEEVKQKFTEIFACCSSHPEPLEFLTPNWVPAPASLSPHGPQPMVMRDPEVPQPATTPVEPVTQAAMPASPIDPELTRLVEQVVPMMMDLYEQGLTRGQSPSPPDSPPDQGRGISMGK